MLQGIFTRIAINKPRQYFAEYIIVKIDVQNKGEA